MAICEQCGQEHHFVLQVQDVRVSLCSNCLRAAGKSRWQIALQRLSERAGTHQKSGTPAANGSTF